MSLPKQTIQTGRTIYIVVATGLLVVSSFAFSALNWVNTFNQVPSYVTHLDPLRVQEWASHAPTAPTLTASVAGLNEPNHVSFDQWELEPVYRLSIPKIGVHTDVIQTSDRYWKRGELDLYDQQMLEGMLYGPTLYPDPVSVWPGEIGNIVMAAHSSPNDDRTAESGNGHLFAQISTLQLDDSIFVDTDEGRFEYQVVNKQVVEASDTSVLQPQHKSSLVKLITCFPENTSNKRMIVSARLVE